MVAMTRDSVGLSANVYHYLSRIATSIGFLLLFSVVGCGRPDDRVVVSGVVTYSGQPVDFGRIRFIPIEDTRGPITIAEIAKGKYLAKSHAGVPVGHHRVEISGYDLTGYVSSMGGPPPKQILPSKYHEQSELQAVIDNEAGSNLTLDFSLSP